MICFILYKFELNHLYAIFVRRKSMYLRIFLSSKRLGLHIENAQITNPQIT
jgi:hypothetical protein